MIESLSINDKNIELDAEGFLKDLSQWDVEVAQALAVMDDIHLSRSHWEVIDLIRKFYQRHEVTLATRALVKLVKRELGDDKGKSVYLMKLFKGSPAKTSNRIAGLPKPDNCI